MKKLIFVILAIILLSCTKNKIINQTFEVTTSYTNETLYGTVNSKDSLIRGFVIGIWNGKEVTFNNSSNFSQYGVGNFGMKPILKPNVTYYIWAYVYRKDQEMDIINGNVIIIQPLH